jgi:hypothetical protein
MWEPRRLATIWASAACYRDSLARKADNLTASCEPSVKKMWGPRRLRTVWASTTCCKDSFAVIIIIIIISCSLSNWPLRCWVSTQINENWIELLLLLLLILLYLFSVATGYWSFVSTLLCCFHIVLFHFSIFTHMYSYLSRCPLFLHVLSAWYLNLVLSNVSLLSHLNMWLHSSCLLHMDQVQTFSSKTLVTIYQSSPRHIQEYCTLHRHCTNKLTSRIHIIAGHGSRAI